MTKFLAIVQLIVAALLAVMAAATVVNLAFISMRPETISVVNAIIGQGILAACLAAGATVLYRKGRNQLKQAAETADQANSSPD